jgi:hypothetical protein
MRGDGTQQRRLFAARGFNGVAAMFNGDFVVVLRDGTKVAGSRRYRGALERLTR